MKVTFYSNFLNHHQLPFCLAMYNKLGSDFVFVATEQIPQDRLELGYEDMNAKYPFVITTYDSVQKEQRAEQLSLESDVIITGSCPEKYITNRIMQNKLTFRYSERIYKRGLWRVLSPRGLYYMYKNHIQYKKKPLYMLCASAYTAGDFALVGAYRNKTYKWGYFPEVIEYNIDNLLGEKQAKITQILWCGRFLDWKHPEKAIYVAKRLKESGYQFHLKMIGIGEKQEEIRELVQRYKLTEEVDLLGSMPPEQVRSHMEEANIFLFTSDFNEGWGAVLNESMNSGCAVIASHAIGSVPFLIDHKVNGLVYRNDDSDELYQHVKYLIDNPEKCQELGKNAYQTLKEKWNAENAVNNFLKLTQKILMGEGTLVIDGPASVAEAISQRKMYKYSLRKK